MISLDKGFFAQTLWGSGRTKEEPSSVGGACSVGVHTRPVGAEDRHPNTGKVSPERQVGVLWLDQSGEALPGRNVWKYSASQGHRAFFRSAVPMKNGNEHSPPVGPALSPVWGCGH